MIKNLLLFLSALAVLSACGTGNSADPDSASGDQRQTNSLQPLKVNILTKSDAFKPGEEGTIKIKVTKGNKNISDATRVRFEIWKKGHKDQSKMFEPENKGNGIYTLAHTFNKKGVYYVITHVTARGTHTMPKKKLVVGNIEKRSP